MQRAEAVIKVDAISDDFRVKGFIGTGNEDWADEGFHQHPSLEITIILEGKGLYERHGYKELLEIGEVVIVPPDQPHRYEGKQYSRFGVIHVEGVPQRLQSLLERLTPGGNTGRIALSRLDKERFERLFREWLRTLASHLKERERSWIAWLEVMMLFLLEHSRTSRQALTITKAADYIRENLQQGVQISDLAEMAGLTESAFRRNFEQTFQMGPKQYQHRCRMEESKWLLSASGKEIHEIAEQVGFNRIHSFSQWFKKKEGISPSEWRNMQRNNY
ncbi:AraC family transcriptional regulator [Paenibacillaceae bacterium]|nr:AraC family transcriptional regulator [Paenibacillaceae bacterium]